MGIRVKPIGNSKRLNKEEELRLISSWEMEAKRKANLCVGALCTKNVEGIKIVVKLDDDISQYLMPLCIECNDINEEFDICESAPFIKAEIVDSY